MCLKHAIIHTLKIFIEHLPCAKWALFLMLRIELRKKGKVPPFVGLRFYWW